MRYAFGAAGTAGLVGRIASIVVSAGLLAALVGVFGGWPGALAVLVLVILLALTGTAAYRLALALDRYEQAPRVYLRFTGTEVAPAAFVRRPRPELAATEALTASNLQFQSTNSVFDFARVRVANDPPLGGRGTKAESVAARVVFYDDDGGERLSMVGRWSETEQLAERTSLSISLAGAQLDIEPNAIEHPLDIAMKRPGDEELYAYNDENTYGDRLGLDKHRLDGDRIRVQVTLRPANGDPVVGEFDLTNGGKSGTLGLTVASAAS